MGSGHILVYAFDVLMQIYTSCGWSERDAAKSILRHNLYGLDIDRRAYQLAYFSVMMKARQYCRRIFTAENQPNLANFADAACRETSMLSGAVERLAKQFEFADTYGSLMTVETPEGLDDELTGGTLPLGIKPAQFEMMMKIAKILGQEYDVVCTNPPYLGSGRFSTELSQYVNKNFMEEKSDLSMVMYRYCLDSLVKENGYISFITTSSWFFLSSFEKLRNYIINNYQFDSIVDYGTELFDGKVGHNPIVSWVTQKKTPYKDIKAIRLVDYCYSRRDEKEPEFFNERNRYTAKQENFSKIPGMPVAYWVSDNFVKAFENPKLGEIANPRQGLACGDVNRFRRMWHEVEYNKINFSATSIESFHKSRKKYAPINDGGAYKKWFGNNECVLMFSEEDYSVLLNIGNHLPSREMYFKRGITWTAISSSTFSVRYFYNGFLFSNAGMAIFGNDDIIEYVLGLLNSKITISILSVLCPTMNFNAGDIKNIPVKITAQNVHSLVKKTVDISKDEFDCYETSWDFEKHPLI